MKNINLTITSCEKYFTFCIPGHGVILCVFVYFGMYFSFYYSLHSRMEML